MIGLHSSKAFATSFCGNKGPLKACTPPTATPAHRDVTEPSMLLCSATHTILYSVPAHSTLLGCAYAPCAVPSTARPHAAQQQCVPRQAGSRRAASEFGWQSPLLRVACRLVAALCRKRSAVECTLGHGAQAAASSAALGQFSSLMLWSAACVALSCHALQPVDLHKLARQHAFGEEQQEDLPNATFF